MSQSLAGPALTPEGVVFTVTTLDFERRRCLISKEALAGLAPHQAGQFGPLEIFQAFEARICGVARRMVAARVQGNPLLLESRSFR